MGPERSDLVEGNQYLSEWPRSSESPFQEPTPHLFTIRAIGGYPPNLIRYRHLVKYFRTLCGSYEGK